MTSLVVSVFLQKSGGLVLKFCMGPCMTNTHGRKKVGSIRDQKCILKHSTIEVLSKMVGPKVRICVTRFLPPIFLDAMKQSPEAAVSYYK